MHLTYLLTDANLSCNFLLFFIFNLLGFCLLLFIFFLLSDRINVVHLSRQCLGPYYDGSVGHVEVLGQVGDVEKLVVAHAEHF